MKNSTRPLFMRGLAALLSLLMLVSALAGCSEPAAEAETDAPAPGEDAVTDAVTEELSELEQRKQIPDDLPEKNYDNRPFRILTNPNDEYQFITPEMTGELTNDEIYNRNIRIGERFGVKIESVVVDAPYDEIDKYVLAGTDDCDIVAHYEYKAYVPISKGDYVDWNLVPIINQDKPWWNKASNEGSTINGKLFCIVGDLSLTAMQYTYAMFYNMNLMEEYGYTSDDMYNMVFDGTWTLDKLAELASQVYVDNNGDSLENEGDTFGYAYWNYHGTDVWVTAMGEKLTTYENGELKIGLGTERVFDALGKVINLVYNTTGAHKFTDEALGRSEFIAGRIGIMPMMFTDCYSALRDMEYDYGILPYPKFNEEQKNYYTNSMDQHSVFGLPKTVKEEDFEFIGVMMEALNAETYKTVYPAFYDTALKNKYSTDTTTAQMIDLIMEGRVFEFSFQFGEYLSSLPYMFRNHLYNNTPDLASSLSKIQKALGKQIDKVFKMYEDGE